MESDTNSGEEKEEGLHKNPLFPLRNQMQVHLLTMKEGHNKRARVYKECAKNWARLGTVIKALHSSYHLIPITIL